MAIQSEKDIEITCKDCSEKFWFTEKEQDFYRQKEYSQPKRCRNCRALKKQQRSQE